MPENEYTYWTVNVRPVAFVGLQQYKEKSLIDCKAIKYLGLMYMEGNE